MSASTPPVAGKEALLARRTPRTIEVEVPTDPPLRLRLRAPTGAEIDAIERWRAQAEAKAKTGKVPVYEHAARMLIVMAVDESGHQLFAEADLERVLAMDAAILNTALHAATTLIYSPAEVEARAGN